MKHFYLPTKNKHKRRVLFAKTNGSSFRIMRRQDSNERTARCGGEVFFIADNWDELELFRYLDRNKLLKRYGFTFDEE